jgi:hypothetical protein
MCIPNSRQVHNSWTTVESTVLSSWSAGRRCRKSAWWQNTGNRACNLATEPLISDYQRSQVGTVLTDCEWFWLLVNICRQGRSLSDKIHFEFESIVLLGVWNFVSCIRGKNMQVEWGCLRTGCWSECFDLKGNCLIGVLIICTLCQLLGWCRIVLYCENSEFKSWLRNRLIWQLAPPQYLISAHDHLCSLIRLWFDAI